MVKAEEEKGRYDLQDGEMKESNGEEEGREVLMEKAEEEEGRYDPQDGEMEESRGEG